MRRLPGALLAAGLVLDGGGLLAYVCGGKAGKECARYCGWRLRALANVLVQLADEATDVGVLCIFAQEGWWGFFAVGAGLLLLSLLATTLAILPGTPRGRPCEGDWVMVRGALSHTDQRTRARRRGKVIGHFVFGRTPVYQAPLAWHGMA